MKTALKSGISLILSIILALSCLAACAPSQPEGSSAPQQSSAPATDPTKATSNRPVIVPGPSKETEPIPEPVVQPAVTQFPEAFELLTYLGAFTDTELTNFDKNVTGAVISKALTTLGGSTKHGSAETVTGAQLLGDVMKLLGYSFNDEAEMLAKADQINLDRGFFNFDPSAPLTTEYAANILLSALKSYKVDKNNLSIGTKLSEDFGVEHEVLTEYNDGFNRPGSKWVSTTTGEDVTGEYVDVPLVVFGSITSYCDILVGLGFALDDPANEQYIPKYLRLCVDGGQLTEKFWKAHNGEGGHGTCSTDMTGGQDATMEVYEIVDYEYRMVIMNTFLAVSTPEEGLVLYGFERAQYGPYVEEARPPYGVYIGHHYWNAYGSGIGYSIVEPATVIYGTLTEGNVLTTTIDGVEYQNGQSYSFGKKMTTAPANAGKQYYFYLDRYGFLLGCSETPIG